MVSNHVMDLLQRYPESELPPALFEYVKRRTFYDYKDHSRVGAKHGEFVDDETCDRFCVLGTPEQHVEKLRRLEALGVAHWNIYLMTEGQEHVLEVYGREIMPAIRSGVAA
jgi:alkanesulfonate monooxygenase SsuD/methylene tetrahydromethanopterin reductase-like flavin-dependent oxidoreductase (luciferase family)